LGKASGEFEKGSKGEPNNAPAQVAGSALSTDDPLVVAAQKEGIDTQGKTKEQIASELSWKLNKK